MLLCQERHNDECPLEREPSPPFPIPWLTQRLGHRGTAVAPFVVEAALAHVFEACLPDQILPGIQAKQALTATKVFMTIICIKNGARSELDM